MTERLRVLVIEDNIDLLENIFEYFEPKGFVLDAAHDGALGLHLASSEQYDVIVLDLNLPRLNGIELCQRLRNECRNTTPVIMLTARDTLASKLEGFEAGADDYLIKPFALPELEARIRSIARRASGASAESILRVGDLVFDLKTRTVERAGRTIELTPITRSILELLMRRSPALVRRQDIENTVWGDDVPEGGALRAHMSALRIAIDRSADLKLLKTVHREGYRLDAKP